MFENRLSWEQLVPTLHQTISPVTEEVVVPVPDALGRVCADELKSKTAVPPFSRSLVDGYAVSSFSSSWEIGEEIRIGNLHKLKLGPDTAMWVPTGGIIPENCEKVIKVEYTTEIEGSISLIPEKSYGDLSPEIELAGTDIAEGDPIISRGEILNTRHLTKLSGTGMSTVKVYRRPRTTIIVTGQEIEPPGGILPVGKVFDSTSAMLRGFLNELGAIVNEVVYVSEEFSDIEAAITSAIDHSDLVISTGGTSMGKHDNVYRVADQIGEIVFHGMNVRPGKPMMVAKIENTPLLAFPGFVTSSVIMASIILPHVVSRLSQTPVIRPNEEEVVLGEDVRGFPGWYRLLTGIIREGQFYPVFKTSSAISSYTESSGYIILGPETVSLAKGSPVKFIEFLT